MFRIMYIVPATANVHKQSSDDDSRETENYRRETLEHLEESTTSVFMTVQPSKTRIFGPNSQFLEAKIICAENSSTWRNPRAIELSINIGSVVGSSWGCWQHGR